MANKNKSISVIMLKRFAFQIILINNIQAVQFSLKDTFEFNDHSRM